MTPPEGPQPPDSGRATAEYDVVLAEVTEKVDTVVRMDASDEDPEVAHVRQDQAAEMALRWIAEHSTCALSRGLAAQAVRAFDTDGSRWYA
ncbi:MAG: hypothetical protein M3N43_11185 [Actinomycetota bacterium]|nr:hypothetical protein [Actinomycetota bacterium]